jgi:SAM-dependent methyltransferase
MRLCKVCDLVDWQDQDFQAALAELNMPVVEKHIHRKYWEFAMGIRAIKAFDKLHENAIALGVGSGNEPIMYYLANHIKHVYATDIYGVGYFAQGEAQAVMLINPVKYAPFRYREDHLTVEFMDGRYLLYDSNMFDIVFSFSSIEHFGSRDDIKQAMKEIGRVLKPGGLAVIATEVILNDQSHPEFFRPDELLPCLAEPGGLELVEDEIDLTISSHLLQQPLQWHEREGVFPHITLQLNNVIFTSVFLALHKSENRSTETPRKIDRDLRLQLSHFKLELAAHNQEVTYPEIELKKSLLDGIPLIGMAFRTFRRKFHELVIFYLRHALNYTRQLAESNQVTLNKHLHLTEQILLKSELAETHSEVASLQAKIEAIEQQIKALSSLSANISNVTANKKELTKEIKVGNLGDDR